jgi:hypothetical protein
MTTGYVAAAPTSLASVTDVRLVRVQPPPEVVAEMQGDASDSPPQQQMISLEQFAQANNDAEQAILDEAAAASAPASGAVALPTTTATAAPAAAPNPKLEAVRGATL